jgi:hypothetical protein
MQRVRNEPALQRRFVQSDGQGFRMHTINRFFRVVSQFRERLSMAVYIYAGQPSRAPELISIRYRNSEQERRNIFIEDGIVVWYLWLVLPFVEQMQSYQRHFRGEPASIGRRAEYI